MNYSRTDAKAYAKANLKGIWAAALMPFDSDLQIDEDGFRQNLRHWTQDLGIEGVFVSGKQGEFYSMTIEERKRSFDNQIMFFVATLNKSFNQKNIAFEIL